MSASPVKYFRLKLRRKEILLRLNAPVEQKPITTGYIVSPSPVGGSGVMIGGADQAARARLAGFAGPGQAPEQVQPQFAGGQFAGGQFAGVVGNASLQNIMPVAAGIKLPIIETEVEKLKAWEIIAKQPANLRNINIAYPLVPHSPKKGEKVYAYAHIRYDEQQREVVYRIVEPKLDPRNEILVNEIKEYIQEKVDINFSHIRKGNAIDYVTDVFNQALKYFRRGRLDENAQAVLKYYVFRDFVGLGRIEPLLNDPHIEDISCDGVGIPLYVYHRDPKLGSIRTNVSFSDADELDSFVNKIAERCGRVISVSKPLLDSTLPDGSRVQATLGSDIARRGSNYTIRMFPEIPITPVDIIKGGTCTVRMMAYYWMLIEYGSSILVSGGTATGKTSMLNVLSLFIKPQMKIVSIEDTAELRLPHAHWVPEVARTPVSEEGKVDMFELLRESLRQRPDYIIVGEVRGKEAYVLFQQMAVGHPGLGTIHAENFPKLFDRLTSAPISLAPNLLQNLDAIVFMRRIRHGRQYLRRITSSVEVTGYYQKTKMPIVNEVFAWDAKTDSFKNPNKSVLLKKIADLSGLDDESVAEELRKRARVLEWIVAKNITDYRAIGEVLNLFYSSPEYLLERMER